MPTDRPVISPPRAQLKAMGISNVLGFDFMDPPPRAALARSLELLLALGALDMQGELTPSAGRRGNLGHACLAGWAGLAGFTRVLCLRCCPAT